VEVSFQSISWGGPADVVCNGCKASERVCHSFTMKLPSNPGGFVRTYAAVLGVELIRLSSRVSLSVTPLEDALDYPTPQEWAIEVAAASPIIPI
jgi:hypothetical protein